MMYYYRYTIVSPSWNSKPAFYEFVPGWWSRWRGLSLGGIRFCSEVYG
jgi:hypothetical protein